MIVSMGMKRMAIVAIAAAMSAAFSTERYLWPLPGERKLSSSFAEGRESHYHAGIDLRTFGRVGIPCFAVDDCEAVRLRVNPSGYGKALYIRTYEGHTVVYAHLQGFCRPLDSLAYNWRLARGLNSCDIQISPGAFKFRKGDVLCYTGSTGALHPHLHFEIRDSAGRPLNPLESLFYVPDETSPIATGLAVVPRVWGSLVDGLPLARTMRLKFLGNDRYAATDTLELVGKFGFAVQAYDKQDLGAYKMGLYESELRIDDRTLYRIRNSSFDYMQYGDVDIEYENLRGAQPGRYLILHRKAFNRMPGREGNGIVSTIADSMGDAFLERGLHRGKILLKDAAGNSALCFFYFFANDKSSRSLESEVTASNAVARDSFVCEFSHELRAEGLYFFVRTGCNVSSIPRIDLLGDSTGESLSVFQCGHGRYATLAEPERFRKGARTFRVRLEDLAGNTYERFKSFDVAIVETGSKTVFEVSPGFFVCVETPGVRGSSLVIVSDKRPIRSNNSALSPLTNEFTIEYAKEAFSSYPRCTFPENKGAGLYRRQGSTGWQYAGSMSDPGGALMRQPGTYAVMRDILSPVLKGIAIANTGSPSGYFKSKLHYVSVVEKGSGVNPESARVLIDGVRAVCEWDDYRSRLLIPIPRSHKRGAAKLRVEVEDRAGNKAAAEYGIVID